MRLNKGIAIVPKIEFELGNKPNAAPSLHAKLMQALKLFS
jgi:hypothetical protein